VLFTSGVTDVGVSRGEFFDTVGVQNVVRRLWDRDAFATGSSMQPGLFERINLNTVNVRGSGLESAPSSDVSRRG
jgi:hypothetical protein